MVFRRFLVENDGIEIWLEMFCLVHLMSGPTERVFQMATVGQIVSNICPYIILAQEMQVVF